MNRNTHSGAQDNQSFREMMELFDEQNFFQRFRRMLLGFKAPSGSGARKFAHTELQRLSAPLAALLIPVAVAIALAVVAVDSAVVEREIATEILDADTIEELDRIEELFEPPPEFEPLEMTFTPEIALNTPAPTPDAPVSPRPAEFDAVAMVRSPIILRGIYGARTTAQRGQMLTRFGGNRQTEEAVLRALRWFNHTQREDGSWGAERPAMTALVVLSYLAHGEKPESPEFGPPLQRGIQFLLDAQQPNGLFRGRDGHNYTHPIVAYALAEAYGLTMNPNVRAVAERAMTHIIEGQQANGGWNYSMNPNPNEDGSFRSDSSYMGWCAQALKAAQMAGLRVEGLDEAMRLGIRGFQTLAHADGGFGYTSRGQIGLSGVGALSMQLLGGSQLPEVRNTMAFLASATFSYENWNKQPYSGARPIYYWYYITQAKFHVGGRTWTSWNEQFSPELVKQQIVVPAATSGYRDHEGTPQAIGHWESPSETEQGRVVLDTTLSALQLMVYYRYLPTFQPPEIIEDITIAEDPDNIVIDIIGI